MLNAALATELCLQIQKWIANRTGYHVPSEKVSIASTIVSSNMQSLVISFAIPSDLLVYRELHDALKATETALKESQDVLSGH